ncbi:DUF1254 domain-containing protein [Gordonia sp. DT30]|uniref:DUF1254 domain-containing protein n=1 Tax=unclassified Gordonia (in: high G+C Gram-positive bacteria) TaxID=2657482 RepID=UPI003CEBAFD3
MSVPTDDLTALATEAYVYLYPLVTMEVSRRQQTAPAAADRPVFGPANQFAHLREFPSAQFRAVVRPNFDTLYSSAWLDLTTGPVAIDAPDSDGRYYMLPMLDMWTDVFAVPGKRTTGTGPQRHVVVPPGFSGDVGSHGTVIEAPTPYVWLIGRTQTNGPSDYAAVNRFQDGLRVTALGESPAPPPPDIDLSTEPLRLVNGMSALDYFSFAADALTIIPPHRTDFSVLARIAALGVVPGKPFDAATFSAEQAAQLEAGAAAARTTLADLTGLGRVANGWEIITESIGVYGNDYRKRAQVTLVGLGANPPDDAVYPVLLTDAAGRPLTGDRAYTIHFDGDQLPPVNAFWSVTMYDGEGYQVANELDRFALGDRDPLRYNDDGSLDLYVQHTDPGGDKTSNWLPAPSSGALGVTLRLYAPQPGVLDGTWTPPPVVPVES